MSVAAPELELLPDAEQLVSEFLRAEPRIDAICGERVFTVYPQGSDGSTPLVVIQRIGSVAPLSVPLVLDGVDLQLDCYGGPKKTAALLAATIRAVLTKLEGTVQPEGAVSAVRFGAVRWLPDETWTPPRPRYVLDVAIHVRAAVAPAVP